MFTRLPLKHARGMILVACLIAMTGHFLLTARAAGPDVSKWAASAFSGAAPPAAKSEIGLVLRRQDFGHLGINQSVVGTPLKIGQRHFEHGLGTHANSEIVVSFPAGTAKTLKASVGVDSNRGTLGSVEFLVEIGGANVFHSPTLRGGDEAAPVNVNISQEAAQIVLKVDATPDGPSSDHADWGAAQLVMKDGSVMWLDELAVQSAGDFWPGAEPPFSFVYDGKSSATLLPSWTREVRREDLADRVAYQIQWKDSVTGLKVIALATVFKDFPAVEWFLRFENSGAQDTPILEKVQALDVTLKTSPAHALVLDQINGDDASERSFVPTEREVAAGQRVALAPVGGRPSNGTFPMFNLQEGARGFFTAIGWTGQWAASLQRNEAGATRLRAGMELTRMQE